MYKPIKDYLFTTVLNRTDISRNLVVTLSLLFLLSCQKDFLDQKPQSSLIVPTNASDFQALLDRDIIMEETPSLGALSCDDYFMSDKYWQTQPAKEHNAYIWNTDIYGGQNGIRDWNIPYQQVFYSNVVLEGVAKARQTHDDEPVWKQLSGSALFIRAHAFYQLVQLFAKPYDPASAALELGIPLRLSADVNPISFRATLQETYDRIIIDLMEAKDLLPESIPLKNRNRPSRPAALALLARTYQVMGNHEQAGKYADSCLQLYNQLIDYNTLDSNTYYPFTRLNAETLYQAKMRSDALSSLISPAVQIDSGLYRSYQPGDLRKHIFFTVSIYGGSNINMKATYNGTSLYPFSGLAVDEVLLIRAESLARAGNLDAAMQDLNLLLVNRWKTGAFVPLVATTPDEALQLILAERRKELVFRGIRWIDLRRLNKEGANISLIRNLQGQQYQLLPNSPLYALPIPDDVIAASGITQNPR